MKFYYFNNHFTTIMQGCYNSARLQTLHKLPQPCHNLTKLQQGCYNLVISVWDSTQNYNAYYTELQANYVLYYKRLQLYYNTLHYTTFPFFWLLPYMATQI